MKSWHFARLCRQINLPKENGQPAPMFLANFEKLLVLHCVYSINDPDRLNRTPSAISS